MHRHNVAILATAVALVCPLVVKASADLSLDLNLLRSSTAVSSVPGDPIAVTVLSNGWQANVTWKGMTCAGVTGAYAFTAANSAPNYVTLNVTSPGFTTAGVATTISRTVVATLWLRQAEPNNLLPTETQSGSNCITTLALSDWINNTDTVSGANFLAATYTSGIASNAKTGVQVTNNSTWTHDPPICSRVTEDNLVIPASTSFTIEVACFHARPSSGKEIQAVVFTASDGTHTATCTTSSMTHSARITGGNPVYVYSCTFGSGSFASFSAGNILINAVAYPIVGDVPLSFAAGQDGTPIAYTAITPNLKPFREVYDPSGVYSDVYAWVQTTGTCTTTACIHTNATDPGVGVAANYSNTALAAQQCQAYNNANRSHNDFSGCHVMVRAGNYNGYDQATGVHLSSLTAGLSWMTIQGAPGTTTSTVVYKPLATGTGDNSVNNRIKFIGVGFAQADTSFSGYNSVAVGQDGENANPIVTEVLFDGCLFTAIANGFPMIVQVGLGEYYNTTLNQTAADGKLTLPFGDFRASYLFYGDSILGISATPIIMNLYTSLGNYTDGMHIQVASNASPNYPVPTGLVNAFNRMMDSDWNLDINMDPNSPPGMDIPAANFASVQNVYEKVNSDGGAPLPNVRFLGDEDQTPFRNMIVQYETLAGQRYNEMYNDFQAVCIPKYGSFRFTAIDPVQGSFNIKRDTFVSPNGGENPARICNWSVSHHVGSVGNVVNTAGDGSGVSSTGWLGEYYGLGAATGVSIAFTTNNSLSGTDTGNGVYTLTGGSGSPAYAKVPSGGAALPFDLNGNARRNDGTGCAGAYEC